jgi:DEAD/DEAH box helicase domain-containing protein
LFQMHRELLSGTRRLIAECQCENGCPGCVGPIGHTGPLAKTAALRILDLVLEHASAERSTMGDTVDAEVQSA